MGAVGRRSINLADMGTILGLATANVEDTVSTHLIEGRHFTKE